MKENQFLINLHTEGTTESGKPAWIALCGVDLQCGAVGCGDTPMEAINELLSNLGIN